MSDKVQLRCCRLPPLLTAADALRLATSKTPQNFTPFQYQDPSGRLMMLPSDIVLLEDSKFKK